MSNSEKSLVLACCITYMLMCVLYVHVYHCICVHSSLIQIIFYLQNVLYLIAMCLLVLALCI